MKLLFRPLQKDPVMHRLSLRLHRKRLVNRAVDLVFQFMTLGLFPHRRLQLLELHSDAQLLDAAHRVAVGRPRPTDHHDLAVSGLDHISQHRR